MGSVTNEVRDEIIRGVILMVLIQHHLEWVPFHTLRMQLVRGQGYALSGDELKFHLAYLSDTGRGYVETKPFRSRGPARESIMVRGTAKAVDLRDSRIASDPGVAF